MRDRSPVLVAVEALQPLVDGVGEVLEVGNSVGGLLVAGGAGIASDGLDLLRLLRLPRFLLREGREVSLKAEPVRGPSKGVIVLSEDGRLRWDNTFEARFRRLRTDLRRRVAPMLLEES